MNASKRFLLCKLLPSLGYPYAVEYKEVLLTTLSTSYTDYQRFLLCKLLPFQGPHSQLQQILFVLFREKKSSSQGETSQLQEKILNSWENSQFCGKFSTSEKILNLRENSHLQRKFKTQQKIINLRENSQLRREFST